MNKIETEQREIYQIYCEEERPGPCGIVIFGASGDLTIRKLLPGLLSLHKKRYLPENFFLLGFSRTKMTSDGFRSRLAEDLPTTKAAGRKETENFLAVCHYLAGDYRNPESYQQLQKKLHALTNKHGTGDNILFYLSVPPLLYQPILDHLSHIELVRQDDARQRWRRVIFEKPFGHDLQSSRQLEEAVAGNLTEEQTYRIDHYLGKETVQNIMMLRFANIVFEPLWNRHYVDHVQITVAEDIGIGHRAGYFDQTGLLRDMFQNHILQLMALIGMEPPVSFAADHIRDEKVKLLNSIHPLAPEDLSGQAVRGQYTEAEKDGKIIPGYRQENGVSGESTTETYAALKLFVENWRWQGVPFYLRSGKRLARRGTEIAIAFKVVPHSIFHPLEAEDLAVNVLKLNIQPQEGVSLAIQAKRPGPKMCLDELKLSFNYQDVFAVTPLDAYARLLLDAMLGDQTLFLRSDNIDLAWQLLMPVIEDWRQGESGRSPLCFYPAGSQGPQEAELMLKHDHRQWLPLSNQSISTSAGNNKE